MHDVFDLGPVPARLEVEATQVRRLVDAQLPQWADLPITPVADGGWDNWTFRLGDGLVLRLPSAAEYALAVDKEHHWLPLLAPHLPVPIPTPVARGVPGADYPHPWSVYRWISGTPAAAARIADSHGFAADLAAFLSALREVDPTRGPRPGTHNWFRGGSLRTFDGITRRALVDLHGHLDVAAVRDAWDEALAATWDGVSRWFHGDVAKGNLLLDDAGRLTAVLDFGTCGVGDPACDLAVAWTLLTDGGRQVLRDGLGADDAEWSRGRGWALWKALSTHRSALAEPEREDDRVEAEQVLDAILRGC